MPRKTFKVTIDGTPYTAMRGIPLSEEENNPQVATCPVCRVFKRKRKPIADVTQFGFTWDSHITIFKCACGAQWFHEYRVWSEEAIKDAS